MSSTDVSCAAAKSSRTRVMLPTRAVSCSGEYRARLGSLSTSSCDEQVLVDVRGIERRDRGAAPLLPVAHEAHVDLDADRGATFEQREPQPRKPCGHSPQEQRLGQRAARCGEVADLVEDEVGDRRAVARADARGVRAEGKAEVDRFGPHRVVVVRAVDAEGVDPSPRVPLFNPDVDPRIVGRPRRTRQRTVYVAGDQRHLRSERFGVPQRGDRFVGSVHRNERGNGEPVTVGPVLLGHELVVETAQRHALLVVGELEQSDARGRIQHREIDPGLAEALVVPLRRRHRGVVLGARRYVPRVREHAALAAVVPMRGLRSRVCDRRFPAGARRGHGLGRSRGTRASVRRCVRHRRSPGDPTASGYEPSGSATPGHSTWLSPCSIRHARLSGPQLTAISQSQGWLRVFNTGS